MKLQHNTDTNTKMMNKDFAVFILTHGRPDNVITIETLKKCGYTGKLYLIIDNEDKMADQYYLNFGRKNVIMFDKKKYADECDECNNFDERRTITMARNACFDIAKKLGITYFIELDDDYTDFRYRYVSKYGDRLLSVYITDINFVINLYLDFYKNTSVKSVAFAQAGDLIGGINSGFVKDNFNIKRKCMNSFICSITRPFKFVGAMNEDVNTYTTLGSRGELFITIPLISLTQKETQQQSGGITDMYLKYGTYCKAFTTVINMPSSVKVSMIPPHDKRLHHKIIWNNTVPKIIPETLKKS